MNDVTGHFEVLVNGNLETYNRIGDIPLIIDNVIKFLPDIPDGLILRNSMLSLPSILGILHR
ncbi:MAG: hypothetical protein CM15mV5_3240 [uncultured marine virus]|nr:MAG: hypothetical protein CM15mV5_3240 [uncultured marine virus]